MWPYTNLLVILFEKTHILSKLFQKPNVDILQAVELIEVTVMDSRTKCAEKNIDCPLDSLVNSNKRRTRRANTIEHNAIENSNHEKTRLKYEAIFKKIIDIYIQEIESRFKRDHLGPILSLYKVLMINSVNEHKTFDYQLLIKYQEIVNLEKLKREMSSFIYYKIKNENINWHNFNILVKTFNERNLKLYFEEIFKVLKIYLTVPVSSTEAERSFSVLKLLKTWLRTTMLDERLSDLAVIKMACDFQINYEEIIKEFGNKRERRLTLY